MIYLDHALYHPLDERVEGRMRSSLAGPWCAQTAPYAQTKELSADPLYQLVGADPADHFVFTSSGAEAINHVVFGVYAAMTRHTGKHHFLSSQLGEAPPILAMTRLEAFGCHFEMVPASASGFVTAKAVAETLSPRTVMLSLSWASGLSGVIQPLQEIAALCEERGVLLHVDATHVLGKGHFPFHTSGAHFLTFDGPPLGAPAGTGGLFIRKGVELDPLILGGREQEGLRAGISSPALYAGLIEAATLLMQQSDLFCLQSAALRDQFESALSDLTVNFFADQPRVPHITLLGFPGVVSETLCYLLSKRKVFANMGGGQFQQIMHLLKNCAVSSPLLHSGLSFALGQTTTREQIEMAVCQIREVMRFCQGLSEKIS